MKVAISTAFAAALLAASSFAFAADNNNGNVTGTNTNNATTPHDEISTGSVNSEGRTLTAEEREYCVANPKDSKCQGLGGEINQK